MRSIKGLCLALFLAGCGTQTPPLIKTQFVIVDIDPKFYDCPGVANSEFPVGEYNDVEAGILASKAFQALWMCQNNMAAIQDFMVRAKANVADQSKRAGVTP